MKNIVKITIILAVLAQSNDVFSMLRTSNISRFSTRTIRSFTTSKVENTLLKAMPTVYSPHIALSNNWVEKKGKLSFLSNLSQKMSAELKALKYMNFYDMLEMSYPWGPKVSGPILLMTYYSIPHGICSINDLQQTLTEKVKNSIIKLG